MFEQNKYSTFEVMGKKYTDEQMKEELRLFHEMSERNRQERKSYKIIANCLDSHVRTANFEYMNCGYYPFYEYRHSQIIFLENLGSRKEKFERYINRSNYQNKIIMVLTYYNTVCKVKFEVVDAKINQEIYEGKIIEKVLAKEKMKKLENKSEKKYYKVGHITNICKDFAF